MSPMSEKIQPDWDPRSDAVLSNQIKAYDGMRRRCPVAHSDYLGWSAPSAARFPVTCRCRAAWIRPSTQPIGD